MARRKLNYVGWLGNNNLGDEVLYEVSRKAFCDYDLMPYNSFVNLKTASKYSISPVEDAYSHVSLFGGGTLLPDDITWIKPAKYNYLFGTAVKAAAFKSSFDSFDEIIIKRLENFNFRLMGVRDSFSQVSLSEWGIDSEVIGDPVLSLKPNPSIERHETRIGINVGCDGFLWGADQDKVLRELIPVLGHFKEKGFELVLIPFSNQDLPYVNELSAKTNTRVFDSWFDPQCVVDFLASCKILIGQRLHSLIISAAASTPFVCLEYRPKCKAFSETVGFSDFCIRTDKVKFDHIIEKAYSLLNNWTQIQNMLKVRVEFYRKKQISFVERLKRDLDGLPENAWSTVSFEEHINNKVFWTADVSLRKNAYGVWRLYNRLIFLRLMRHLI